MFSKEDKIVFRLAGRKRSGKGMLADYLVEKYGATKITVATYIKKLCGELLGMDVDTLNVKKDDGTILNIKFKDEWCEVVSDKGGIPIEEVRKLCQDVVIRDVRHMLQFVGTDVIRRFNPNWHVQQAVNDIDATDNEIFVVDDMRFPNEKKAFAQYKGASFYILRPSCTDISNHESETALNPCGDFCFCQIINNSYPKDEFISMFAELADGTIRGLRDGSEPNYPSMSMRRNDYVWKKLRLSDELGFEGTWMNLYALQVSFPSVKNECVMEIAKVFKTHNINGEIRYKPTVLFSEGISPSMFGYHMSDDTYMITDPMTIEMLKYFVDR